MANPVLQELMNNYIQRTAGLNILRIVTPKNQHEQKDAWLDAAEKWDYKNPYFLYDEGYISQVISKMDSLKRLKSEIMGTDVSNFSPVDRAVIEILKNRTESVIATVEFAEAMLAKRDGVSGEILRKKYGQPSRRTVTRANEYVSLMREAHDNPHRQDASKKILMGKDPIFTGDQLARLKSQKVTPKEAAKVFQQTLEENGYDRFRVSLNEKAARIRAYGYAKEGPYIVIPDKEKLAFPALYIAQMAGREIDCRARILDNGAEILRGIGSGAFLPDDQSIYDGITARYEIDFNCSVFGRSAKMPSPWEVLAINELQKGRTFAEVGKYIFDLRVETGTDYPQARKEAWDTTFQVLKGCRNPNHPEHYAFYQARQEFEGFHMIPELIHDKRVAPWLDLGVFELNDIHYLKQHIRDAPVAKHSVGNLAEEVAKHFLDLKT